VNHPDRLEESLAPAFSGTASKWGVVRVTGWFSDSDVRRFFVGESA